MRTGCHVQRGIRVRIRLYCKFVRRGTRNHAVAHIGIGQNIYIYTGESDIARGLEYRICYSAYRIKIVAECSCRDQCMVNAYRQIIRVCASRGRMCACCHVE